MSVGGYLGGCGCEGMIVCAVQALDKPLGAPGCLLLSEVIYTLMMLYV